MKNKWMHRYSYHEALIQFLCIVPPILVLVVIAYLVWAVI
jgi:hypothetical protein